MTNTMADTMTERCSGSIVILMVLSLAVAGCGYRSHYVPARDGRARPVWRDHRVVAHFSGSVPSPYCLGEVKRITQTGRLQLATGEVQSGASRGGPHGYWVPIVVTPPLRLTPPGLVPPIAPPGSHLHMGHDLDAQIVVMMAIVAMAVLPIVDLWLAVDPPEADGSPDAIAQVNALNDLQRMVGSPCSPAYLGGPR